MLSRQGRRERHLETKKQFLEQFDFSSREILKWYSKDIFFYRLLNRLLRAGKDSTQVYYGQHFTKLIALAIKQMYQKQKSQQQKQVSGTFNCYRGACFSQKQIKELKNNIGKHIQTLGFMSTSTKQSVAFDFLGENGNALLEIEVSPDTPKDGKLDLGYAYLGSESSEYDQEQVLFNVLSSFQVKSVSKFSHQGREVWRIKLKYGVTYQMVHKYKQNKLKKGTAEEQLILAILSRQSDFKGYNQQEKCLQQQNAVDGYIWMRKTKISLLKSIPHLWQLGQLEQFSFYDQLTTNKRFKGKQQKYLKQIEPKYLSSINSENTNQSANTLLRNMNNIFNSIVNHYENENYESVQQLAKKWRQLKQDLLSDILYQLAAAIYPDWIENMEQQQTFVSVCQAVANIVLLCKTGDMQKLKQQIQAARPLQQLLLVKYDRYHPLHMGLRKYCMDSAYNHGLVSYEAWLEFQQQQLTCLNGIKADQQNTFELKLVSMQKQANRHIQQKQWAQAVELCAEFRDEHYKGREKQDEECFKLIINQLNKNNSSLGENVQILQACLSVKHPKDSAVHKIALEVWRKLKQKQEDKRKRYRNKLRKVILWSGDLQLAELNRLKQERLLSFETQDSLLQITSEHLIVNGLRRAGRYQEAYKHVEKLKKQYSAAKYHEFHCQVLQLFDN